MEEHRHDVIVIGGGVAGSAAALRAAQYEHLRVLWIRGDKETAKRSRAQWVANIDNMIGIHDGIVRQKLVRRLRGDDFAMARTAIGSGPHEHISTRDIVENTVDRLRASYSEQVTMIAAAAERARRDGDLLVVEADGREYHAPWVVLATGVMDRQPRIKRQKGDHVLDDPRWIYPFANRETVLYCIRCEGHLTRGAPTAVIGHQETAAQLAMMLHERYGSASAILTNGEAPAWSEESSRLLGAYGIAVHPPRITEAAGKGGELNAFTLEDGTEVRVHFALVSLGLYRVYNDLALQLGAELEAGEMPDHERHVLIEWNGLTSVPGLFAIGDLAKRRDDEPVMKQVYTAQEYAVRAIDTIDRKIRQARRKALR